MIPVKARLSGLLEAAFGRRAYVQVVLDALNLAAPVPNAGSIAQEHLLQRPAIQHTMRLSHSTAEGPGRLARSVMASERHTGNSALKAPIWQRVSGDVWRVAGSSWLTHLSKMWARGKYDSMTSSLLNFSP